MKKKELERYMGQKTWFHGTTLTGWKNLCKSKVQADYNKGSELDFGAGFYMTPSFHQAEGYIRRILPYLPTNNVFDEIPVVIEFELCLNSCKEYKYREFLQFNVEFALFVFENREKRNDKIHNFDFIIGVMSDSNPVKLLQKLKEKKLTKDEVVKALCVGNSMQQVSLHNQNLCDILQVKRALIINSGKELDASEYNKSRK